MRAAPASNRWLWCARPPTSKAQPAEAVMSGMRAGGYTEKVTSAARHCEAVHTRDVSSLHLYRHDEEKERTQHREQVGQDGADETRGHNIIQPPVQRLSQSDSYLVLLSVRPCA